MKSCDQATRGQRLVSASADKHILRAIVQRGKARRMIHEESLQLQPF
jgi:hypothetical protein